MISKSTNKLLSKVKNKFNMPKINIKIKPINFKKYTIKTLDRIKNKLDLNSTTDNIKATIRKLNPGSFINNLQDQVEKIVNNEQSNVMLKQPKFWASSITWLISGGTIFVLAWFAIAKTDEIVIATGRLEPKGGVVDVQMPLEGITQEILAKEGEQVKKGQVLIRLDTELTEAKNKALERSLDLNKSILDKLGFLVKQGAVSEVQYMQQEAKVEDIKTQIKANLVRLKYQEIIAPVDGVIFKMQPKGPGYVAQTSQPVLKIVPLDSLVARIEIDSNRIGFVRTGKSTEINIDSFPANDFGVIDGTLTSIGSDALVPIPSQGKGYRFPADVSLNKQYIELKSGEKLRLHAGMSLTANIKLRKVTYLQLFLNKFGAKTNLLKAI